MKFKNICFILISLIILITLTSVVYANDDNATNNNNLIKSQIEINQMENIDEIKILENKNNARKDNIDQNTILNLNETQRNNLDYIVTNQTFHDYFDENGLLKEDVASGATLDFQGKFIANENESFIMNITKPINIISTTHDAYIDMNTTAQGKNAEIPGNHITICREGFSTNITGITFHNSQIYLNNTSYITLNNISVIVENQRIGYSVISIFDNSTHITIKDNYFFTKNFYGTYTLFLNMTNNCIIHNNTFELDDNADSPIYLYYDSEVYDSSNYNFNNNITNNKFFADESQLGKTIIMVNGQNTLVENNTAIDFHNPKICCINSIIRNNILNNGEITAISSIIYNNTIENLIILNKSEAYNNTLNDLFVSESIVYNTTINMLELNGNEYNATAYNCFIKKGVKINSFHCSLKNSTILGNISFGNGGFHNLKFNNISGNLENKHFNIWEINITNNNITGKITLNYDAFNIRIINNFINSTEKYTIILSDTAQNNIIRDNLLISVNSNSDASVSFSDNSNIVTHNYPIGNNSLIVLNTTLTGTNIGMYYNDIQQYQVKLTDSNNKPLPNETIKIKFNGKTTTLQTNENGVVVINIELKKIGTHEIIAKYEGTIKHNKSTTTNKIQIINPFTKNINMSMYYQEKINYKIQIIGKNNKPIKADERIIFKINKKTIKTKTNKNGYATIKLTLKPGKYTITTIYKNYKTINQIKIKPTLITKNIIKKKTKTIKFTAKLINTKGKPQTNKKIKFKIKRKTYTAKTNKKGYATVKITNLKTGKHKITTTYQKQKTTNKITIKK